MCTIITMHRVSVLYCYNIIMVGDNNIIIQPVASRGTYIIIVLRRARVYNNYYYFYCRCWCCCAGHYTNEIGTYLYSNIVILRCRNSICRRATEKSNDNTQTCLRMHREP